ncbi:MAG: T9SS type A sorting domain-containing protein [Saprospiraceae bacterium]|nr:T9SS type A sorting domain-containing protein [Saprospiraceae bacterium]
MHSIVKYIFLLIVINYHTAVITQRYDFNWVFGYGGGMGNERFGITKVDFISGNPIQSIELNIRQFLYDANASISNTEGRLMYYSNGYEVKDSNYLSIKDVLITGPKYWDALIAQQGVMFLPLESVNASMLFYIYLERVNGRFLITRINYIKIEGTNKIIEKGTLVSDTLNDGFLTACKHANGRDWWLLLNKLNTNLYYNILVQDDGSFKVDTFRSGPNIIDGIGQAKFLNDGKLLAFYESISDIIGATIYLFSFDRCSGKISFIEDKPLVKKGIGGISFSPNSRYLYHSSGLILNKYEIINDRLDNLIQVDSITDQTLPWGSQFNQHQLGPDGRIYITNLYSNFYQHVINKPDEPGLACDARSNGFMLKTIARRGVSNNPNYRLGPIDDSICDTLGINNIPWAWWRRDQDTSDHLNIEFTDLSAYEVTEWEWSFEDGRTSISQNPIHRYSKKGTYEVCLIAKNKNGADTLCKILNLGVSNAVDKTVNIKIELFPNPCDEYFVVNVLDYIPQRMILSLFDLNGKEVLTKRMYEGSNGIDVDQIHQGVYIVEVFESGKLVKVEKVIKM